MQIKVIFSYLSWYNLAFFSAFCHFSWNIILAVPFWKAKNTSKLLSSFPSVLNISNRVNYLWIALCDNTFIFILGPSKYYIDFKITSTEFYLADIVISPHFPIALSRTELFLILLLHNTFASGSFNQLPRTGINYSDVYIGEKDLILSTDFDILFSKYINYFY